MKFRDFNKEDILKSIEPVLADLKTVASKVLDKPINIAKNLLSNSGTVSGSVLLITGNEGFDDIGDYTGAFHTTSINLWRTKLSYSESEFCRSYGGGYILFGTAKPFGISYSNSNYILLCSNVYNEKALIK